MLQQVSFHLGLIWCTFHASVLSLSSLQPEYVVVTEGPWLVLVGWVTALSLGATVGGSGLSARVRMRTWPAQVPRCAGRAAVTTQVSPQLCSHWQLYSRFYTQALSHPQTIQKYLSRWIFMHSSYILHSNKIKGTRWLSQCDSSSVTILFISNNSRKKMIVIIIVCPIARQLLGDSFAGGGHRIFPSPMIFELMVVAWAGIHRNRSFSSRSWPKGLPGAKQRKGAKAQQQGCYLLLYARKNTEH